MGCDRRILKRCEEGLHKDKSRVDRDLADALSLNVLRRGIEAATGESEVEKVLRFVDVRCDFADELIWEVRQWLNAVASAIVLPW